MQLQLTEVRLIIIVIIFIIYYILLLLFLFLSGQTDHLYFVTYDDGDEEAMSVKEVCKAIAKYCNYKSKQKKLKVCKRIV